MRWYAVILVAILFVLAGCGGAAPSTPAAGPTAAPNPVGGASNENPRVSDTTGAIVGTLLDEQGTPVAEMGVILATLVDGPQGTKMIAFQMASSKRGYTDAQGRFTIDDVESGEYSLVVWTPQDSQPIPPPGGAEGSAILVQVQAGKVNNLGQLQIRRP